MQEQWVPMLMLGAALLVKPISAQGNPANARFSRLTEQFIHETLALSPSNASDAGYHKHFDPRTGKTIALDSLLDDMSPAGIAQRRRVYTLWRDRFHKETPLASLGPEDAADWQLIDDQIAMELLELDRIRNYQHNPTMYVELIGDALFQPLNDDYAAEGVRLGDIVSRIAAVPRFLNQARAQLADADPIFIKVAIEENQGDIDLINGPIAAAVAGHADLKARFDRAAPPALKALQGFSAWMSTDLSARKTGRTWRQGKELYAEKFHLVMETDITPDQLLAEARQAFDKTRDEMFSLALPLHKQYYPDHSDHADLNAHDRENRIISEVLAKIADDHPSRNDLIPVAQDDLVGIRRFIIDKKIVSLTSRDNLKVIPTPEFERGVYSVGGFHSAPPLDPKAEADFWITPISSETSDERAESKLREYNIWVLKWLCLHEAIPGHYVQAEHANDIQPVSRRLVRALYGNGAYIEGWAEYGAQVVMNQGFADNDPRYRLSYLKIWLRSIANSILDIRMQTMNMTDDEALHFMMDEAFQTRAEAEGKLQRAKLSSVQLATYFVGTTEWWRLRNAFQAARGKDFSLEEFHDRALDEGALPVPWLKNLLLAKN